MGDFKSFDCSNVVITFGAIILNGFAPGSKVKVTKNEDAFKISVGVDGDSVRTKTNNRSGRVTCTLLQTSESNLLLSAVHNEDQLSPSGDGILPLSVIDKGGTTVVATEHAWIVKDPDIEFAGEAKDREWVFEFDAVLSNVGGALPFVPA